MKSAYIIFFIFTLIIIVGGLYFYSHNPEGIILDSTNMPKPDDTGTFTPGIINKESIHIFRVSEGNTHTYRGVVTVPTPCHAVTTQTTIAESYPEQITLDIFVRDPAPDIMCAQVITDKEFFASFEASPDHTFSIRINGERLDISIEETPQRETSPKEIESIQ